MSESKTERKAHQALTREYKATFPLKPLQRKPPAKRAFTGMAGSPLARPTPVAPTASKPKLARPVNQVLLHYCFDQRDGETKPTSCTCKEHIDRDLAGRYVTDGRADWLLTKNPKKEELVQYTHAAVVTRMMVDDEELFAIPPKIVRTTKEDRTRDVIRREASRLLTLCYAKKIISKHMWGIEGVELDRFIEDPEKYVGSGSLIGPYFEDLCRHWWANLLVGSKLSVDQGKYILYADPGVGLLVTGGYDAQKIARVSDAIENDSGHVVGANFRPQGYTTHVFGKVKVVWDKSSYSAGRDPVTEEPDGLEEPFVGREEADFNKVLGDEETKSRWSVEKMKKKGGFHDFC